MEPGVDAGLQGWGEELGINSGSGLRAFEGYDLLYAFKKPLVPASGSRGFGGQG